MNKVILMGRLIKDPEVKRSQGEKAMAIARYTLAVDRRSRGNANEDTPDFINCTAFDKSAEFAEKYFKKGSKILVTGRLQTGSYTNRDGQKVYTTDVMIEDQEFADSKPAGNSAPANNNNNYNNNQNRQQQYQRQNSGRNQSFVNVPDGIDDGGLPFN